MYEDFKPDPIIVNIVPSVKLLRDVLTTAVEGGIGYWSQAETYKWRDQTGTKTHKRVDGVVELEPVYMERNWPEVTLVPAEDPDDFERVTVTPEHLRKGLQLALTPGILNVRSNTFTNAMEALFQDDSGYIDADAADNILQLGLFGKLVFS